MLFYVHDLLFFNAYYDHKFNKVSRNVSRRFT